MMIETFTESILSHTGAQRFKVVQEIQDLWSGYGKILRLKLEDAKQEQIIVKLIKSPAAKNHPRGWSSDFGHQRKLKSYAVETKFYQNFAAKSRARIPIFIGFESRAEQTLLILEDLDLAGFPIRKQLLNTSELEPCLHWLAKFHASFLHTQPMGLWAKGSYWHLDTRPDEWEALQDKSLKAAAVRIDQKLESTKYKTLIHGDAKLANFCFAQDGQVAAVDFQYTGAGCGMKDLAYFIGSCLSEEDCEKHETEILDTYFRLLQKELVEPNSDLEVEWRALYRVAWADFHRFLKGWSPGHWKINSYSERLTNAVIKEL